MGHQKTKSKTQEGGRQENRKPEGTKTARTPSDHERERTGGERSEQDEGHRVPEYERSIIH